MTIDMQAVKALHDRAIYLVLDWSMLGTWKGVETKDTSSEVRARKRTVKSDALKSLSQLRYKVRAMLRHNSLNSLFRPGVYCIPLENIEQVDAVLQEANTELIEIRQQLTDEWPSVIADAQERLGNLFDPRDYDHPEHAAKELNLEYRYVPIANTPNILKGVAAEIYQADLERSKVQAENELEAFRAHLREALLEVIQNMRKTLTKPDGEKRVFGQRFFKRLDEFLNTFSTLNLSDDGEMAAVVEQLRTVAAGSDPVALKASDASQLALDKELESITVSLEMMVEEGRAFSL
jgi:hypothetical protein